MVINSRRAWTVLALVLLVAGLLAYPGTAGAAPAGMPIGSLDRVVQAPGGARVAGWAFDPDSTASIYTDVYVDGRFNRRLLASGYRPDVAAAYRTGTRHGFDTVLLLPAGRHTICTYALNVGRGSVNPQFGCRTIALNYNPSGSLDAVRQVPGGIRVAGWAADPDSPAPVSVDVYADGRGLRRLSATSSRPDVARAYPAFGPNRGYDATLPLGQGTHRVCAYAINIAYGNTNPVLGCRTITLNFNPVGGIDTLSQISGGIRIAGWASDPDVTTAIHADVYADGKFLGRLLASDATHAGHGFTATFSLAEGTHTVCVYGLNVAYGNTNPVLGCRTISLSYRPFGHLDVVTQAAGGVRVAGWAIDPDTSAPIHVDAYADGKGLGRMTANSPRSDIGRAYPAAGANHGFDATYPLGQGSHNVCVYGINVGAGSVNPVLGCSTVTLNFNPRGAFDGVARDAAGTIWATGWATDPDTSGAVQLQITLDGKAIATATANAARADVGAHGFRVPVSSADGEHTVCVTAVNVGAGSGNTSLGCKIANAIHPVAPGVPRSVQATATYGAATVSWAAPAGDGGAPVTSYRVTASPGGRSVTVGTTSATVTGLGSGTAYTFTVTATNVAGTSQGTTSNRVVTPTGPPPQTTPAPISTSRYIRNLTGGSGDLTWMRGAGAADAAANPSGHAYLILLDIGGQDYAGNGVVLSATTRWISNPSLVNAVNAYVDGYASRQRAGAPVTIAVGTNNDMQVSSASGAQWARNVVNPVVAHAARYGAIRIAGANDIEPGFRGTVAQSRAWLSGYLGATSAQFVFNGSADGCSWRATNAGCNRGWTQADLQWLAGGAAPSRIVNLPQIYNSTMATQWKYISLTGVGSGKPRINFGGPLTEWTACSQAGCGSMTGNSAWTALWGQLRSDSRVSQGSLPYSTDLRIN